MKNVLILNDVYMPVNVVSMKKAFKMMVKSSIFESIKRKDEYHIDIIEYYEDMVHAGSGADFPRPAVIRIAHYKNPTRKNVKLYAPFTRNNVWERDNRQCQYCGKKIKLIDMHWDHIVPRKLKGKTTWTNIVCACFECNAKKADLSLHKSGLKLLASPKPVYNEISPGMQARDRILRKVDKVIPKQWASYLDWMGVS
jgi:5-methylcytosine-specific restriction endonuclease McrA